MDRAELLNQYFCSVCTQDNGVLPGFPVRVAEGECIDHIVFNRTNVHWAINKLKANMASGADNIPPVCIKKLSSSLAVPLSLMFESFMSVGKIPADWRKAVVIPVYKVW